MSMLLDILEGHGKDEKYVARLIVGIYVHHHPVSESFCYNEPASERKRPRE